MKAGGMMRAGAVTFSGLLFGAAATFILTGVVGNTAGPAGTGLFFQAVAFFAIAASALQLGADTALVRTLSRQLALGEIAAVRPTLVIVLGPVLIVGLLFGGACYLGADAIATVVSPDDAARTAEMVRVVAPFTAAGSMLAVVLGATRGLGSVGPYTLVQNVLLPGTRLALVSLAAGAGLGLQWLVGLWAAPVGVMAVVAAVVLIVQLRGLPPQKRNGAPAYRELARIWGFAAPRGASALIERILDWAGVIIVIALAGPAAGGVYAVVNRIASAGYMIDQAVRIVTGPRISRALALGQAEATEALFLSVTRAVIVVSWPFYLLVAIFAPTILDMFGPGFAVGGVALSIVSLSLMTATTAGMVQSILLMGGRSSWQLGNRLAQLSVLVVVTALLVPSLGLVGAAIGWAAAIAVDTTLATTQVWRSMQIRTSVRGIALPAILTLAVFGAGGALSLVLFGGTLLSLAVTTAVLGSLHVGLLVTLRRRLGLAAITRPDATTPLPVSRNTPTPTPTPSTPPSPPVTRALI